MALSQRYPGKVLTPWFNVAEWKETKKLIYSDSAESQQFALNRMKMWKIRTPLLSIGIEGTLILLEALLVKNKNLTDYEMAQIFSTALLRFLNICAASNDRQGTFYKTAEKNDLPYWLITLRHEIAHDHKIPSKAILECALSECFKWIKQKYWEVQDLYMKDYTVSHAANLTELIYEYVRLNQRFFFKENIGDLISKIRNDFENVIPEDLDKAAPNEFILLLEDFLLQSISKDEVKDSSIHIVSSLVEENIILSINCLKNDVKKIPPDFLHIWHKIIDFLYQNGTIFLLINKLADLTRSSTCEHSEKEIASLWIAELYQGFIKTKKMKHDFESLKSAHSEELHSRTAHLLLESLLEENPAFKDVITFHDLYKLPVEDSKSFQERILKNPNEFTLNYLELVLRFNGNNPDFIKEQTKNIKKLVKFNPIYYAETDIIHTVKELQELYQNCNHFAKRKDMTNGFEAKKIFRKLSDAEKFRFKGYPLGLLPP